MVHGIYRRVDQALGGLLPGGVPMPMAMTGATLVKTWVSNGVLFGKLSDGKMVVQKKDGTVKIWRPYKPVVFGKRTDVTKFTRLAKKYRKEYQELHKLFGKPRRRSCK